MLTMEWKWCAMNPSRFVGGFVFVLLTVGCGSQGSALTTSSSQGRSELPATGEVQGAPVARAAPGTCSEAPVGVGFEQTLVSSVTRPVDVGFQLLRGTGQHFVTEADIQVLPPGAEETKIAGRGGDTAFKSPHAVASTTRVNLAAADVSVVLTFTGRDSAGALLPSGLYTATFRVSSVPAPGSQCAARGKSASLKSGVLATIDWRP